MKYRLASAVLVCLMAVWVGSSVATETESDQVHLAAAHELFQAMQLEKTFAKTLEASVDIQIKQNPIIVPYRKVMLKFFSKYMSWDSLKDDMAQIYVAEFSVEEIKELTAFYKTPVGTKAALLLPQLMREGGELGARRVQEHMGELQRMIAEESKRLLGQETPNESDANDVP